MVRRKVHGRYFEHLHPVLFNEIRRGKSMNEILRGLTETEYRTASQFYVGELDASRESLGAAVQATYQEESRVPKKGSRPSVRTISGGLPTLGRRAN
jgi:hypothetical protein